MKWGYRHWTQDALPAETVDDLTPRIREAVELAANGYIDKVIAERMGIKKDSVKSYLLLAYEAIGIPRYEDGVNPRVLLAKWYWSKRQE